jgi:glycosyltransferase involved in cell wall biosynthesis/polysaccharide pyruvyl transferase WcaK-like protein
MTAKRVRVFVLDQAAGLWGAQSYLLRLAAPLAERGFDLVLAGSPELALAQAWTARGLEHIELPLPLERSVRADGDGSRLSAAAVAREAAALSRGVRAIARAARACGADVLHANGHAVHLEAALAGRLARIPVVLHLHEEMDQAFGRALRFGAVAVADRTVAVSNAVAGGVPAGLRQRVQVIGNGVDVTAFAPASGAPASASAERTAVRSSLGSGPSDVVMVALTRLDPDKRIGDLIAAAARLQPEPGWHLAVVGTTSSYDDYARAVMARGAELLGGRVSFPGRREDVAAIINAADIVVHAGMVEGMPLGLIEAQACARPVIAYAIAGVPEAVLDGVTGLLAPGGDVGALSAHMQALIDDPVRRRTLGTQGRAHAVAHHDIETQADDYAALLTSLTTTWRNPLSGHSSPAPRVLLANHWHDDNRGDSAITQGILSLVKAAAPDSTVTVTTLAEPGALWDGSTRHLSAYWPGLRSLPSPFPTELRGRTGNRSKARTLADAAWWGVRMLPRLPNLVAPFGRSAWRELVDQHDVVVLVGGSNIFDDKGVPAGLSLPRLIEVLSPAQAGVRAGKPTLLVGHTLGPFSRPLGRRIASVMLRNVSRVVVREAKSVAVAQGIGIDQVEEAADMAFALVPERTEKVEAMLAELPADPRRTVVLSARQHPTLGPDADDRLVSVLAETARTLIANGTVDGVAVVAHTIGPTPVEDDRPISRRLVAALGDVPVTLVDEDVSPAELSAFYGAVGAVVAVRLHAAILALNAGTATFAVSYLTGKTQGVMSQVGLPNAVGDFATVTAADAVREIESQLADATLRPALEKAALVRREQLFTSARHWFGALSGKAA